MLYLLFAYLVGSLVGGLVFFPEIRGKDLPGGSGVFRKKGPRAALLAAGWDVLKGVLVAWLAPEALRPYAGAFLVAGHTWPLFFRFRGGGGIAPSLGYFLVLFPEKTLLATGLALLVAGAYHLLYFRRRRGIYPIPFGAIFGYLALFLLAGEGRLAVGLVGAVVLLRGLEVLRGRV
jgi:glycerol-3-phosphate acyltransferase PlsY